MIRTVHSFRVIAIAMVLAALAAAPGFSQGFGGFGHPGGYGAHHGMTHRGTTHRGMMQPGFSEVREAEYLAMMIPHHQEAVDRSRELLEITEREEMRRLLNAIVDEQTSEIEWMEDRLSARHSETAAGEEYVPMMRGYEGLDADEAELIFLEDMMRHHMHAVMQSRLLIRSGAAEDDEMEEFAVSIIGSQLGEIERMRGMYAERYEGEFGFAHGPRGGRSRGTSRGFRPHWESTDPDPEASGPRERDRSAPRRRR